MNRSELTRLVSQRMPELSTDDAEAGVAVILDAIADALGRGHRVEVRGFGSFSVRKRPARTVRNPRTGQTIDVQARNFPYFKPGKALRERVDAINPQHAPEKPGGLLADSHVDDAR